MNSKHLSAKKVRLIVAEIVLIILAIVWLCPLLLTVLNAFKTQPEIVKNVLALPAEFSFHNFAYVIESMDYPRLLLNTIIVTVGTVLLVIIFAPMCAYKLSRVNSKISKVIFLLIVISMLVPFQSIMIPLADVAKKFGFVNSIPGVILLQFVMNSRFMVFLYYENIQSIPLELDEAGKIDGCNDFNVYFRVIFPQLKPITATVAILTALWTWNDFALTNIMLIKPEFKTLPTAVYAFFNGMWVRWDYSLAALVMAVLPIMIFFVIMQKYIIKGIMDGSVKG